MTKMLGLKLRIGKILSDRPNQLELPAPSK